MRTPGNETIVVKPELIRLVRRDDSKKWQAHYKLENLKTWFRRSTDTANAKEAAKIAERMWMKATFDLEEGRQSSAGSSSPWLRLFYTDWKLKLLPVQLSPAHVITYQPSSCT